MDASRCARCGAVRVDKQLGLEVTPDCLGWATGARCGACYVCRMVEVFREVRRVLRRDGTCWLNIGDSYATGAFTRQGKPRNVPQLPNDWAGTDLGGRRRADHATPDARRFPDEIKAKDLVGVPWMLAFALRADGWYLRSEIIWAKSNPMPESVTDRPTKAHEQLFLLTKRPHYYFDADAIREPAMYGRREWSNPDAVLASATRAGDTRANHGVRAKASVTGGDPSAGRNKRSVWEIASEPFPDAHFATFPQALVEPCVLAGTSERGCCPECGAPWERETEATYDAKGRTTNGPRSLDRRHETAGFAQRLEKHTKTIGWRPTCGHNREPVACVVLDPFLGSGTTALVARRLGRRCVGIELSPEYAAMAARRTQQLSLLAGAVT